MVADFGERCLELSPSVVARGVWTSTGVVGVVGEVDMAGVELVWVVAVVTGIGGGGGTGGTASGRVVDESICIKPKLPPSSDSSERLLPPMPFSFSPSTIAGPGQPC